MVERLRHVRWEGSASGVSSAQVARNQAIPCRIESYTAARRLYVQISPAGTCPGRRGTPWWRKATVVGQTRFYDGIYCVRRGTRSRTNPIVLSRAVLVTILQGRCHEPVHIPGARGSLRRLCATTSSCPRTANRLQLRAVWHRTRFQIAPQRDEHLARERNNANSPHAFSAGAKPALIPLRQGAFGLIA